MANVFVKIDTNMVGATHAALLRAFVAQERTAYELGVRVLAIMTNNHDGTDFSELEKLFGLAAGDGSIVFDYVNGTIGAMEGTFQNNNGKSLGELIG